MQLGNFPSAVAIIHVKLSAIKSSYREYVIKGSLCVNVPSNLFLCMSLRLRYISLNVPVQVLKQIMV